MFWKVPYLELWEAADFPQNYITWQSEDSVLYTPQPLYNTIVGVQGSGNFEIWIGPADDDDVINEPISKKKKKNMYISSVTKTNDNWQSYNSF